MLDDDCDSDNIQSEDKTLLFFMAYLLLEDHSCFAHMLHLIVKDGIPKAGEIGNVIKKCSKLASFVRKSTVVVEKKLEANNATRWIR